VAKRYETVVGFLGQFQHENKDCLSPRFIVALETVPVKGIETDSVCYIKLPVFNIMQSHHLCWGGSPVRSIIRIFSY
jgi:hypothetical protein